MSKTPSSGGDTRKGRAAAKPEPGSREARLAEALRANLRRRKVAVKKTAEPTAEPTPEESGAADGETTGEAAAAGAEKSPKDASDTP